MTKKFKSYEEAAKYLDEVDQSDFSQLSLTKKEYGWTIAHQLVNMGKLSEKFMVPEILSIDNSNGWTVAHELVSKGNLPEKYRTPEILLLKYDTGYIYELFHKYKNLTLGSVKDTLGLYLIAVAEYNYHKISYEKFKVLVDNHGLEKMKQMVKLTGKKNQ